MYPWNKKSPDFKNLFSRYEHLLDMAQKKEEGTDPADDPRKLKPGFFIQIFCKILFYIFFIFLISFNQFAFLDYNYFLPRWFCIKFIDYLLLLLLFCFVLLLSFWTEIVSKSRRFKSVKIIFCPELWRGDKM